MPDVLLIEPCNFEDFPPGGQLSFAKQMISAFGNRLALVGISTDGAPVGHWVTKRFDGSDYRFFAFGHRKVFSTKPLVPARITAYLDIARHRKAIMSLGVRYAFTQSPETLMAIYDWPWNGICYMTPGCANPLKMARYRWARPFTKLYDAKLFSALKHVDVILACADKRAIEDFARRSKGLLQPEQIIQFPTRVDTAIFRPLPFRQIRQKLELNGPGPLLVVCGRINKVKGWDLLILAFRCFQQMYPNARLVFVGDGEDSPALEQTIDRQDLAGSVLLVGFQLPNQVAEYLNAADVVIVGSYEEGWSVAMLEALACGQVVVSTDVSGARDMIIQGRNGLIIPNRDPEQFASAVAQALVLERPNPVSLCIAEKYSLVNLRRDLCQLWQPLSYACVL
jgi:glycosyltransferase involved in cell wall biosynthesis